MNAAVPALKRPAHAFSGHVGAGAAVRFKLRVNGARGRRLLRGRLHVLVNVTGTDGRLAHRKRPVTVHR